MKWGDRDVPQKCVWGSESVKSGEKGTAICLGRKGQLCKGSLDTPRVRRTTH